MARLYITITRSKTLVFESHLFKFVNSSYIHYLSITADKQNQINKSNYSVNIYWVHNLQTTISFYFSESNKSVIFSL